MIRTAQTPHTDHVPSTSRGVGRRHDDADAVSEQRTQGQEEPVVHILWINAGLSCDGDSVSLTAATQPSIEDIVLGALPGLPKVAVHWPLIDFECGPDAGRRRVHRVVLQGRPRASWTRSSWSSRARSPTRRSRPRATGAASATTRRPASRSPPASGSTGWRPRRPAVLAAGTCATYGGIHAMAGNPTGAMGVADYLGWDWRSKAGLPIVNVPGCPIQPDNMSETLLYLLYQVAGQAPMIPLDEAAAADLAVRQDRPRGLRPGRLLRAGRLRHRVRLAQVPGEDRLLGAGGQVQRPQARLDGRHRRLPERRRHLHRAAPCPASPTSSCRSWTSRPGARVSSTASGVYGAVIRGLRGITAAHGRQGAEVAAQGPRADHRLHRTVRRVAS